MCKARWREAVWIERVTFIKLDVIGKFDIIYTSNFTRLFAGCPFNLGSAVVDTLKMHIKGLFSNHMLMPFSKCNMVYTV